MDRLSILPDELLLLISRNLQDDSRALLALSLVSKEMHIHATNTLYREIYIDLQEHMLGNSISLLRTLLERPERASRVRYLSLCLYPPSTAHGNVPGASNPAPVGPIARQYTYWRFLEQTAPPKTLNTNWLSQISPHWKDNIGVNLGPGLAGLLLLIPLPNLRRRSLSVRSIWRIMELFGINDIHGTPLWDLSGEASPIQALVPGLQNVKTVFTQGRNLSILHLLFHGLENLSINLSTTQRNNDGSITYCNDINIAGIVAVPQLRELLVNSDWSELDLQYFRGTCLSPLVSGLRCTNLRAVYLSLNRSPRRTRHHLIGSFSTIVGTLKPIWTAVERLVIRFATRTFHHQYLNLIEPATNIDVFQNLLYLEVPQQVLVHRDYGKPGFIKPDIVGSLPPSTKFPVIIRPTKKVALWLNDLVEAINFIPSLRNICLSSEYYGLSENAE